MTAKHLTGTSDIAIPPAASVMYERSPELAMAEAPEVIEWTDEREKTLIRQFRDMDKRWWLTGDPDSEWDDAEAIGVNGKHVLKGNCNAWTPMLLRRLLATPDTLFARGSMRLTLCRFDGEGHMVLSITTTAGTLILCPVVKMQAIGKPALELHDWIAWEGHNGAWEGLKPVSLADAFAQTHESPHKTVRAPARERG